MRFRALFFILFFVGLYPNIGSSGETCAEKMERALKEISDSRDVRFHGLPDTVVHYRSYILDNKPDLKRHVPLNNAPAERRLGQMYGNASEADVKYMMQERLLEADFKGGEASIFRNPENPREAVKVWNDSRIDDFEMSTRAMLHYEARVEKSNRLKNYFSVSKIKERGKNYIVKEFNPKSTPLKDVAASPDVKRVVKSLKRELSQSSDPINQKLMVALNRKPVSDNLHWDPQTGKVLMIDALGF